MFASARHGPVARQRHIRYDFVIDSTGENLGWSFDIIVAERHNVVVSSRNLLRFPSMTPATWIEARNVSKAYAGQTILDRASVTIERGAIVAVIGRSGSGKSTLLRLFGGLEAADAGTVLVGGVDLGGYAESERAAWRRRDLGFVFQFFNLLPTLTVVENVELPLALNGRGAQESRRLSLALLEELGLRACADRFPEELSGGEQQRVAIARAVVHEPQLVLADEPTGNLDADTARQVLSLLRRTCERRMTTLVMATHSTDVAAQATRVIAIQGGHIVERTI
jgi:putative ABC transport system ATP-binding protein